MAYIIISERQREIATLKVLGFDDEEVDVIYSESFSGKGIGQAIMNRLMKAAGQKIIRIEK